MTFETEFDALLPETITYEAYASEDGYGARTYATAKTVKARVEQLARMVRDAHGREVVSQSRLFLKPLATDGTAITPTVKDRYTLPAGYDPQVTPAISVSRANDPDGLHHFEVSV